MQKPTFTDQERKALRQLKKYAPKWTTFIRKYGVEEAVYDDVRHTNNDRLSQELNMVNNARCIVGEIHGFTRYYINSCNDCRLASESFCFPTRFTSTVNKLIKHIKSAHPDIKGVVA